MRPMPRWMWLVLPVSPLVLVAAMIWHYGVLFSRLFLELTWSFLSPEDDSE